MGRAGQDSTETEVKLRVGHPADVEARLHSAGFRITKPRVFEANTIFDDASGSLRSSGCLIRLRQVGGNAILTFKGPPQHSKHKSREELETTVGDVEIFALVLKRIGFVPHFRYEKYRTELERPGEPGTVTMDETPIGWFLELEGYPDWIDRTAGELGFTERDYILDSYAALYFKHCDVKQCDVKQCAESVLEPTEMAFKNQM